MAFRFNLVIIILIVFLIPLIAFADTIVFHSGKPMEVEQAWEKGDKVYFYLNGLKASIYKKEVLRIEKNYLDQNNSSFNSKKCPVKIPNIAKEDARQTEVNKPHKQDSISKSPQKILNQNKQDGFRDLDWGAPLGTLRGLVELKTDTGLEEVKEYVRENDLLKLGEVDLKSIVYAFWRDQFYTVTIWTEGKANYVLLRNEAIKRFGAVKHSDPSLEKCLWSDASTDRMLKFNKDTQVGMLWMRSKKIDRRYKLTKLDVPSAYLKWIKSGD